MLESGGIGVAALDRDTGTVDLIQVRFGFRVSSAEFAEYYLFRFTARGRATIARRLPDLREDIAPQNLHNLVLVLVPNTSFTHVDASAPALAKFAASTSLLWP